MNPSPNEQMDPFTQKAFPPAAERWLMLKNRHKQIAQTLWAGMIAEAFTDHELRILDGKAYLSAADINALRAIGRPNV